MSADRSHLSERPVARAKGVIVSASVTVPEERGPATVFLDEHYAKNIGTFEKVMSTLKLAVDER